ncbi:hypothetical protein Rsub_02036 [Raphidocelis subcapitata]|uniref:Armadillo-like repeats domain-containing protein n=1 Tax=Raphidocelis subcapitata TaxID=307507 RepID=A0A2V0NPE5_9CHLO|nr:hypothetical protein Rsub_02036 [Raphidocelis subcapitata]|eukprot:GBF89464.1 hypothetical protein Rsub_02036 [Raphidocelis subcapitata]
MQGMRLARGAPSACGRGVQRLSASRGLRSAGRRPCVARPQALGRGWGTELGAKLGRAITGKDKEEDKKEGAKASEAAAAEEPVVDAAAAAAADGAAADGAAHTHAHAHGHAGLAAAAPEAVREAGALAGRRKQEAVEYEEIEIEETVKGIREYAADAGAFLTAPATRKGLAFGTAAFLGATFAIALYRVYLRSSSVEAQRRRTVDRNKQLVQGLSQYLPDKRDELTAAVAKRLQRASGFTPVEVFRKYLWYVLRERRFDPDAVSDMVALKGALGLGDGEVAEALRERAQRIYDKYGTLMLSTEGMSASGLQRKATCQALFSKMLYLTEHEPLVAQGSEAFKTTDLRLIFGAMDEDTDRLRIVSLVELDAERLDRMMAGDTSAGGGGGGTGGGGGGGGAGSGGGGAGSS